jgi:hypothetical protein
LPALPNNSQYFVTRKTVSETKEQSTFSFFHKNDMDNFWEEERQKGKNKELSCVYAC